MAHHRMPFGGSGAERAGSEAGLLAGLASSEAGRHVDHAGLVAGEMGRHLDRAGLAVDGALPAAGRSGGGTTGRAVRALPKAHLHLHLTGAMRHTTLIELANERGVSLPDALTSDRPPNLSGIDERDDTEGRPPERYPRGNPGGHPPERYPQDDTEGRPPGPSLRADPWARHRGLSLRADPWGRPPGPSLRGDPWGRPPGPSLRRDPWDGPPGPGLRADPGGRHPGPGLRGDPWGRHPGPTQRGWFRFQRLYDIARSVLRTPADVHRIIREAAEDDRAEGSGWLEIQVDPSGYAGKFGGLTPTVELVLDAAAAASAHTGVGIGVIVAANRTRHPLDAKTLARLAAQYAGRGVVGFGLSADERRGGAVEFAGAFRIAARAGLLAVPHGGELAGPASVRACLAELNADRIGHGVRAAEDPALLRQLAARGTTLEVCPTSNVALGVVPRPQDVPLQALLAAGVNIALGADDPLLFRARLAAQYELARHVHVCTDPELAELARMSVLASAAPASVQADLLAGIDAWLATPTGPD